MLALATHRALVISSVPNQSSPSRTRSVFISTSSSTRHISQRVPLALVTKAQKDANSQSASPSVAEQSIDQVPAGCSRYSVSLGKPLGLVLEEQKSTGSIVVAEIIPGGNAEKSGVISVGDQLIATSGYTRTTEQTYNDITVRGGEQVVRLPVRGESFDTVLAAIGSHPGNFQVKLEFQQCEK